MTLIVTFAITLLVGTLVGLLIFRHLKTVVVNEDTVAVAVNRDGFIKRILPAGRHLLRPFEHIDFTIPTKTSLATGRATAIATGDGILAKIDWSGTYSLQPSLITESRSQRLRNLLNADKAITRNADILLRKLVGHHSVRDLFNPAIRDRLERRLSQVMAAKLKPLGIAFNGLNLQSIELPPEVAEALNKAKAIETLDGAIRQLDPATREVVRGVYQLDEILRWDQYLPVPSRMTMKRLEAITAH
jgi:regulator of protease activity HflC (stomatin/prohibitin superfamily)